MHRLILGLALIACVTSGLAEDGTAARIDALIVRGDALFGEGNTDEAARVFDEARLAAIELRSPGQEAAALIGIALTLQARGAFQDARDQLSVALQRADDAQRRDLRARALLNQAAIAAATGEIPAALALFERAAEAARRANLPEIEARALVNAGRAAYAANEQKSAEALLVRAGPLVTPLAASRDKAYLLISLGEIRAHQGSLAQAHESLIAALRVADELNDDRARSYALGNLARLYIRESRVNEAIGLFHRAIASAQKDNAPEPLFRWNWELGRAYTSIGNTESALPAYRTAIQYLQEVRSDIAVSISAGALTFREVLGPLFYELADLLLTRSGALASGDERQALLREARATVELSKAAELEDYFSDGCVAAQRKRVGELELLGSGTAVIYPIMLRDRLELLVSHAGGFEQVTVVASAQQLTDEIRTLRERLEKRTTRQYLTSARHLYDLLFAPLEPLFARLKTDTLVLVPDGPLRTIPFAALYDGKQFLVNRFAFATTPGLTLTDPHPLPNRNFSVLVNALTESVQGFPALPSVETELLAIREGYVTRVLRDRSYSIANLAQEVASHPYTIVHIASHAQFDRDPRRTFLLTYDSKITMDGLEKIIAPTRLRENPVELLALSACQTATGDDRAALGLAGVALKAGARSALASLWFINDEASSKLIAHFYEQLRRPGTSKAQALQNAQRSLMDDSRYAHPAYWAPFLLIGNWL